LTQNSQYPMALPEGAELAGDYVITRTLGAGGFGITYEARERSLDRLVAIKEFFPIDIVEREGWALVKPRSTQFSVKYARGLQRFIDEARTITQFNHPNIVKVLRYFKANNTAFMVLSYEQGLDFDHWQQQLGRRPTEAELKAIALPLLDALERIHKADFLHRDIAPDNIIIRHDGSPVLIDFGSARSDLTFSEKTVSALVKSGYSPFEQYAKTSKEQGPWTDIYSFAATLYQAVTLMAPPDSLSRLANDEMQPAAKLAKKHYSRSFLEAIDRALALKIDDRPQNVREWRMMLFPPDAPPGNVPGSPAAATPTPTSPLVGAAPAPVSAQMLAKAKRQAAKLHPAALSVKLGRLARSARDGLKEMTPRLPGKRQPQDGAADDAPKRHQRSLVSMLDDLEHRQAREVEQAAEAAKAAKAEAKALARQQRAEQVAEQRRVKQEAAAAARALKAEQAEARRQARAEAAAARGDAPGRGSGLLRALPAWLNQSMMIGLALIALAAGGIGFFGEKIRDAVEDVQLPRMVATNSQPPAAGARLARTLAAHDGGVAFLRLSDDGSQLVSAGRGSEIKLWQPQSGDLLAVLPAGRDPIGAADTHAGVLALGDDKGFVSLLDLGGKDAAVTRFQALDGPIGALAFVGGNYDFVLGGGNGKLQYWSYDNGNYTRSDFRGRDHEGGITSLAGGERYIVSAASDGIAKIWGRSRRTLVRTYRGHDGPIDAITISADGRRIATAGADETVRLWSNAGSRVRRVLKGHTGPVHAVAFSPDSKTLASGGSDALIRLWDVRSGKLLQTLEGHTGAVRCLVFAADGKRLYSAGDDETIRFWDLEAKTAMN
jgi:serine/threonine protein kinase